LGIQQKLFNPFGVRFGVRDMKSLNAVVCYETSLREKINLRFRPQKSIGTGATGNGRVGSCRGNTPHHSGAGMTARLFL
jgi:hypothetical protein